jgi:tubulin-specific chaperone A
MKERISAALEKLEEALVSTDYSLNNLDSMLTYAKEAHKEGGAEASAEDVTKAKDAVAKGKEAIREAS